MYLLVEKEAFEKLLEKVDILNNKVDALMASRESTQELLGTNEAVQYLGVCAKTLQRYRDEGKVEFSKISGKKILYKKTDLEKLIHDNYMETLNKK